MVCMVSGFFFAGSYYCVISSNKTTQFQKKAQTVGFLLPLVKLTQGGNDSRQKRCTPMKNARQCPGNCCWHRGVSNTQVRQCALALFGDFCQRSFNCAINFCF